MALTDKRTERESQDVDCQSQTGDVDADVKHTLHLVLARSLVVIAMMNDTYEPINDKKRT